MEPIHHGIRSPVKRKEAEQYILISLVSFAISVVFTRLFLELTGYPQLGNEELHIAHVVWGGLLLFIASLLPLIFANRWTMKASALIAGAGMGLFIDEIGKFITQSNDYFYPPAAPIIYAFFLLIVLLYIHVRRPRASDPRSELYTILNDLEEILDHDLDPGERVNLENRLQNIAAETEDHNLLQLAVSLNEYLQSENFHLSTPRTTLFQQLEIYITNFTQRTITRPRLKVFLVFVVGIMGVLTIIEFGALILALPSHQRGIVALLTPMIASGELHSAREALWYIIRIILEGLTGVSLIISGGMLIIGKERGGIQLANLALVIWLTVINLLVFYQDQFSAVISAAFQLFVLLLTSYYRQRFLTPLIPTPQNSQK